MTNHSFRIRIDLFRIFRSSHCSFAIRNKWRCKVNECNDCAVQWLIVALITCHCMADEWTNYEMLLLLTIHALNSLSTTTLLRFYSWNWSTLFDCRKKGEVEVPTFSNSAHLCMNNESSLVLLSYSSTPLLTSTLIRLIWKMKWCWSDNFIQIAQV